VTQIPVSSRAATEFIDITLEERRDIVMELNKIVPFRKVFIQVLKA
jgi:hypothetical protein